MREQQSKALGVTRLLKSNTDENSAIRKRYLRRLGVALLTLFYAGIIATGIGVWSQPTINWDMQLDPRGAQTIQSCIGTLCATYGWKITSETGGGNAFDTIPNGAIICAYYQDGRNNNQPISVSSATQAKDILSADRLTILSQSHTCNEDDTASIKQIPILPAAIDFVIAIICATLAALIYLYATQRSLAIHTVAFLSGLVVAFGWLPPASIRPLPLGIAEVTSATAFVPPLLATLLWRMLLSSHEKIQGFWLRTFMSLSIGIGVLIAGVQIIAIAQQNASLFVTFSDIALLLFAINVIIALGAVIASNLSRRVSVRRDYARIIGVGAIIALLPLLVFAIIPLITKQALLIDSSLAAIPAVALPLSLAYVVLRRDLLGVTSLVRTTAERSLRILALAFVAAILLSIVAAVTYISTEIAAIVFVSLFLIALLSPAAQAGATWITEHWIFPEVNRYRSILSRASAATVKAGIADPQEIANEIVGETKLALPVRHAALFVGNKQTGQFIRVIDATEPHAPVTIFDSNHPVPELLRSRGSVINQADLQEIRNRMTIAMMTVPGVAPDVDPAAGWDTFVPIMLRDELIAILVLGERDDEFDYSSTDRALLLTLASRRALALDYARVVVDLRAAYEQQKELDEMKDQFIMTAHHELRTPLTGLLGYIELLRDMGEAGRTEAPEDVEYFLNSASKSGEDLADLMKALLQADQKNIDRTKFHPVLMDVSIALHSVANNVDMSFNRKSHRITVRCDPQLKAWADPQALSRVLTNLLSNAIKYSPEQSPVLITAHRRPDVEAIEIIVRDWGNGIPAEEQRKVFERFVRLERDLNSPVRGTGLGLYVARSLIESMGGRIWVESAGVNGMGTTFRIVLPIAPPPGQPVEEEKPTTQPNLMPPPSQNLSIQQMDTDPRLKTLAPTRRRGENEFRDFKDGPPSL